MLKYLTLTSYKAFEKHTINFQHTNILVGPNNCGKSTIIGAFRLLSIALRRAHSKRPERLNGPEDLPRAGHLIPTENLSVSLENVHTNYSQTESRIEFGLSNGNKLIINFPIEGPPILYPITMGKPVLSPTTFKEAFPLKIQVVPTLGPVIHEENIRSEETVRKGLNTHLASSHFRNYWHHNPEGFNEFATMVKTTWPGMEIETPSQLDFSDPKLTMFCHENRIPRELYWAGFGFQIWCQLLTHISRSKGVDILVVDEPEVYLHPDIQRQLLSILKKAGPDIVLATHSSEIIGEADANDILLVDKAKRHSTRLKDSTGVQIVLNSIGSVNNLVLTRLARNRRLLFVEDLEDFSILKKFAEIVGLKELASGDGITPIKSEGFGTWEQCLSFAQVMRKAVGSALLVGSIFDRDYYCEQEILDIQGQLERYLSFVAFHEVKEIENFLLNPTVLSRALSKAVNERARRSGEPEISDQSVDIDAVLEQITSPMKTEVMSRYIAKQTDFLKSRSNGQDSVVITEQVMSQMEAKWEVLSSRLGIVPGKKVLARLREDVQRQFSVNLSDMRIASEFRADEIPVGLRELIRGLDEFRISRGFE